MNEFLLLFSNTKSKYSSKRIGRAISFAIAMSMIVTFYIVSLFFCALIEPCKIDAKDVAFLSGIILVYGGYNTKQIINEKKTENETQS